MTTITIERARPDDVSLIRTLIAELAEYERLAHEAVATDELLRDALFGVAPTVEALIARADDEAVGFALFFHSFSTFLGRRGIYLEDLYVRPAARGLGIGRALLQRLAAVAVERGCARLEWSVLDWNEPAVGFYKALGARPMDAWTVFRLSGDALERLAASR